MTIVTGTVPLVAINGGTSRKTSDTVGWCSLSDKVMIVLHNQTTPTTRFFSVVENPVSLSEATGTVVKSNVYNDTILMYNQYFRMERLTDNSFLVMNGPGSGDGNDNNWTFEVFTYDGTSIIKRSSKVITTLGNRVPLSKWANAYCLSPMGDNSLMGQCYYWNRVDEGAWSVSWVYYRRWRWVGFTVNPTTYEVTNTYNNYRNLVGVFSADGNTSSEVPNFDSLVIPGTTDRVLTMNGANGSNSSFWGGNNTSMILYVKGTNQFTSFTQGSRLVKRATTGSPIVFQAADQQVVTNWARADYRDANDTITRGWGTIQNATDKSLSVETVPAFVLPIDINHHIMIDSRHFESPTTIPFRMKVVRRDDTNWVTQSEASNQSASGFTVNVPKINTPWCRPKPVLTSTGDIMWAGIDTTDTTKFRYCIIKNPPLSSS